MRTLMDTRLLHQYRLSQVPLTSGIAVGEETPLGDVLSQMRVSKTGCVVTQKENRITGIFTERDFLEKVLGEKIDRNSPIDRFVTKNPVTMNSDEPLRKAIYLMRKKNFRHIPVCESDGEFKGILSIRNVIKLFAEHFPHEVINLPPRLSQNSKTPEGG